MLHVLDCVVLTVFERSAHEVLTRSVRAFTTYLQSASDNHEISRYLLSYLLSCIPLS